MSYELARKLALRSCVALCAFNLAPMARLLRLKAPQVRAHTSKARSADLIPLEPFPFVLLQFMLRGVHAIFDAMAQRPHDGEVNLALAHAIFNARVDTRIVVHLDDYRVTVPFLQVHAVKPVANQATNA